MRLITTHTEAFKFAELDNNIKDKIIADWYDREDYPFLEDDIKEELYQISEFWSETELQYSLRYCQGDGLSFTGEFELDKWLEKNYPNMKISVFDTVCNTIGRVYSKANEGHYCYSSESDICTQTEDNLFYYNHEYKRINQLIEEIENKIIDEYIEICNKLKKYGYSVIEYRMNYAEFEEFAESNEYEYRADGEQN